MLPTIGAVSLLWVISCLSLSAAKFTPDRCCNCDDLKVIGLSRKPQIMPSPFKIKVGSLLYEAKRTVYVNLTSTGNSVFRSFFIGAYLKPYVLGSSPVGSLTIRGNEYSAREVCTNSIDPRSGNALVSDDDRPKRNVQFEWKGYKYFGHLEFRATFVVDDDYFWVSEKSRTLWDYSMGSPVMKNTLPINTDQCGVTKGCFREPAGCIEPQCLYILTWQRKGNSEMIFELGGLADGSQDRYVAAALSDDTYMGDDSVFICAHNSVRDRTEVFLAYNKDDPKTSVRIDKYRYPVKDKKGDDINHKLTEQFKRVVLYEEGSYQFGRLRCRFTVNRDLSRANTDDTHLKPIRGSPKHLLLGNGFAVEGQPERHGLSVNELPMASSGRVDLSAAKDYSGRARYPLAKAHGCLMILAWIFFASVGLLMTKYYKPMWPNERLFGQRYWFVAHFNCMATMFIITIIAIILIFVEAEGYSEAPELPQRAHPILGIIILVCICINPILALLRGVVFNECRPVFNWIHWLFGTVANVLAIPQIFIGMDFGKVMVPWWATWILVIWVIFHIAVELTLEIHQCCTYKKNKERRKKHEALKREYPKQHHPEPEPAGRRFKRFMLFLHLGITALITLIMIIIIAVA